MRVSNQAGGFAVRAIAGSYVILLGMDATPQAASDLLGFGIRRKDWARDREDWLEGMRTFEETAPHPMPGELFGTNKQPIQGFLWGDYTVKPDRRYTYTIVPITGTPAVPVEGKGLAVDVTTESEESGTHAVFFNRGVAASQAYSRKFGTLSPDEWETIHRHPKVVQGHHEGDGHQPEDVWVWLSRGLQESMLSFIGRASGPQFGLRAAVYEFNYPPVLKAFAAARDERGADVRIVYDSRGDQPGWSSYEAMTANGVIPATPDYVRPDYPDQADSSGQPAPSVVKGRRANPSSISHNKFIVLLQDGEPIEVWTGSTNITTGGIFGQSNVGHAVRDPAVAKAYLDYRERLFGDPDSKQLRTANIAAAPDPVGLPEPGITPIFSPRPTRKTAGRTVLDWYAERMDGTEHQMVCFTAAFGVNALIQAVLAKEVGFLRYVLLEKKDDKEMQVIGKDKDNRIAYGALIDKDTYGQWLHEQLLRDSSGQDVNVHVKYVHTKYMLIDALTDDPLVITGSANFSDASTEDNDENMLIIRGDTRVADIYLGEFMRLFNHMYFRDLLDQAQAGVNSYLAPDSSWTAPYYDPTTDRHKERVLFSGQP